MMLDCNEDSCVTYWRTNDCPTTNNHEIKTTINVNSCEPAHSRSSVFVKIKLFNYDSEDADSSAVDKFVVITLVAVLFCMCIGMAYYLTQGGEDATPDI